MSEPVVIVEPVVSLDPTIVEPEPVVVDPVVSLEPTIVEPEQVVVDPVVSLEPTIVEPEPVVIVEPEPVVIVEPEPVVIVEPEPVVVDPEPVVIVEPEPVVVDPVVSLEPTIVEPEPVVIVEPTIVEPEPVVIVEPVVVEPTVVFDLTSSIELIEPNKVIEEIKEEIIKSFTDLLIEKLNNESLKDTLKINIDSETKNIIFSIIKNNPEYFSDIEKLTGTIVADGKVDSNDIPNIIILIEKLYESLSMLKDVKIQKGKIVEFCSSILKFLIHYMVAERKIEINSDVESMFLEQFDKLIDSCMNLITLAKMVKKQSGFSCFKH